MRYADPELLYARFIRHTQGCGVCRGAGGEAAADGDLCAAGKALLDAWGRAEAAYARVEAQIRDAQG